MRIVIVAVVSMLILALGVMGCAHRQKIDPPKTAQAAPRPCGPDDCGKTVEWANL